MNPENLPVIVARKRRVNKKEIVLSKRLIRETERGRITVQMPVEEQERLSDELLSIPGMKLDKVRPWMLDSEEMVAVYSVVESDENLSAIAHFGKKHHFEFESDIGIRASLMSKEAHFLEKISYAKGVSKKTKLRMKLPKFGGKPYRFQYAAPRYALRTERCFIADEMGVGKTVMAAMTAGAVIHRDALQGVPWLVVAPLGAKTNWRRELKTWLIQKLKTEEGSRKLRIRIVHNKDISYNARKQPDRETKQFLQHHDIYIVNYDRLQKWFRALATVPWKGVIFDESHYIKARSKIRSRMARELVHKTNPRYRLLLSGTPLMNNPYELINQLDVLGRLGDFGGYNHFLSNYASMQTRDPDAMAKAAEAAKSSESLQEVKDELTRKLYEDMVRLNKVLRSCCFIRREKSAVLPQLPPKQRTPIMLEINNRKTYQLIENDVISWLMNRVGKDKKFLKSIEHLPPKQQYEKIRRRRNTIYYKSGRARALVKLQHLKLAAAMGKLPAAKQWIYDFLESGKKLVVFCHHKIIQRELLEEFPDAANSLLMDRDKAIDKFQNDPDCRLFIGSLKRDGEAITLTAASSVAFVELLWTPAIHDQAEDRVHRIGQIADSVNAYYLMANDTVEERIAKIIEGKRQLVNAVADGDPLKGVGQGSIFTALVDDLVTGKKAKKLSKKLKKKKRSGTIVHQKDVERKAA